MILLCWVINNKRKHDRLENSDDSESNDDDSDILLPESSASKSDETKLNFGAKLATPTSEDITNLFRRFLQYITCFC